MNKLAINQMPSAAPAELLPDRDSDTRDAAASAQTISTSAPAAVGGGSVGETTSGSMTDGWFRRYLARIDRPLAQLPAPAPHVDKSPLVSTLYAMTSVMIAITYGLGLNLVNANLNQMSGEFSATTNETLWLTAAYMVPNVSLSLLLIKIRAQYGLRRFAELAIIVFIAVNALHFFTLDLGTAIIARFFAGIAAAPMSTLSFLYLLECFPPAKKMTIGMPLVMINIGIGSPIARLISPALIDLGGWQPIYALEVGLALISFALIYSFPLSSPPKTKVLGLLDVVSYLFLAAGFGALAVVLSMGRSYWWFEAPWLGWLLAISVVCLACMAVIELNRTYPLLDIKWLTSPPILHFAAVLMLFRMLMSEQTSGVSGLFQQFGLLNDQQTTLYAIILVATILGGFLCAAVLKPGREPTIHVVALSLLSIGAYMDSQLTTLTRPEQMYVSQALIAVASSLFLAPAMTMGFINAMKKGANYILSFVVVFLFTQSIGGLLGSALLGTFVVFREKYHSAAISEHLVMTDPLVVERIAQLGGAYSRTLTDPVLRQAEGMAQLAQQVTQQAYALAYADTFFCIAVLSALSVVVLLGHMGWTRLHSLIRSTPSQMQPA